MCLIPKNNEIKIATEDITCYKVLVETANELDCCTENNTIIKTKYVTPFCPSPVFLNVTLEIMENGEKPEIFDENHQVRNDAVFHVFDDKDFAISNLSSIKVVLPSFRLLSPCRKIPYGRIIVVKAIIPKGAKYVEGTKHDIGTQEVIYTDEIVHIGNIAVIHPSSMFLEVIPNTDETKLMELLT